ncbi:hypothetical protein ACOSQ3_033512 [Xanthoceras sorbifolium]
MSNKNWQDSRETLKSSLSARVPSMYILHCSSVFLSFFLFPPLLPLNSGWFPGSFVTFDWGKLELVGEMIVLSLSLFIRHQPCRWILLLDFPNGTALVEPVEL